MPITVVSPGPRALGIVSQRTEASPKTERGLRKLHLAAKVSGAWGQGRVAWSTSLGAGSWRLQVGAAKSAGTAVIALFSYSLNQQSRGAANGPGRHVKCSLPNVWCSLLLRSTGANPPMGDFGLRGG